MKNLKKGERGLTLLELLIALALTAAITTTVTGAIFQTFTASTRSNNHMVAVRQVQEAGYWVSHYAYGAQGTEITGPSGFALILDWVDFDTGEKHEVEFSLTSSGLRGHYYIDGALDEDKTGKVPAFGAIDPDETSFRLAGGSAFSLPDIGDAFNITGDPTPDWGVIDVRESDGSIAVSTAGGATYNPATGEWATSTVGDDITVTATSVGTKGSWTSETKAVSAAVTVDVGEDSATLSTGRVIFTVTATVGTGNQETSKSRVYEIVPKPVS